MKIFSANINGTLIEFDNCMWSGNEYVYVNGEEVSKKFSWFGTNHHFEIEEDGIWVEYTLRTRFDFNGISANLTRDGIPLIKGGKGEIDIPLHQKRALPYRDSDLVN